MKIHEILNEDEENPDRNYPNPMKVGRYNSQMYDKYGDYEDEYVNDYRKNNNITDDNKTPSDFPNARDDISIIQMVPISKIIPNEEYLYPEALKALIKKQNIKSSSKFPVLIKYKGEYHIEDGNHRVAAAYKRGEDKIEARVVDLDNYLSNR